MKGLDFDWQLAGAFGFGVLIGWYIYFVNRYRKGDVQASDIVTLIGAIGGSAVLALFDKKTDLFGAYGVGLAVGFFTYFVSLLILVARSQNFDFDWFLDGRRKDPATGYGYGADNRQTVSPMAIAPQTVINFHGTNPGDVAAVMAMAATSPALAAPNPDAVKIQQFCSAVWMDSGPDGPYKDACNYFAIEVAHRLGLSLSGLADEIIASVRVDPAWTAITDGPSARQAAMLGKFVIAGVPSDAYSPPRSEGHVAIVTAGPMNGAGWAPAGYWGSTDSTIAGKGGSGMPISNCFTPDVKDFIVYRARDT